MPHRNTSRWNSLATRITVVFTLFVLISTLVAGLLVYRGVRDQLLQAARNDMARTAEQARDRLESAVRMMSEDIAFLSENDAVNDLSASYDSGAGVQRAEAMDRVSLLMASFIRSRQQYAQVRLIGVEGPGRELVRFDRDGSGVRGVAPEDLQIKGDRDYFLSTMALAPGERYFSPIDLNREQGRISVPHMPTLRAAAPLFAPSGKRTGIVVINADLRPLFEEIQRFEREHQVLVLADPDGHVLLHPDTARMFRHELGEPYTLADLLDEHEERPITAAAEWGGGSLGRPYRLEVLLARNDLLAGLHSVRNTSLAITAAIALLFALMSLLYARSIGRVLTRLTERVERYAKGEREQALPVGRKDEIGRLARSLAHMQERIDARVDELQEARHNAEVSDKARRDLLANMSHEVRTPLSAIVGMSDALGTAALSPEEGSMLGVIQRSAQRLQGLVDDLLLHARIQEGRLPIHPSEVDIRQLVEDVVQVHGNAASAKGVAVIARTEEAPERWTTDPLRVHQVMDNLVGNAVKFTPQGTVVVEADVEDGYLRISVTDTGPGIAPEDVQRVFERFERAVSNEQDEAGAGLGLAITRRLIDLLGGSITVQSTPGKGTRFAVRLPALTEVERRIAPEVDPGALEGLRVMHVEDVATNRLLMEATAKALGWSLVQCADPREAIQQAAEHAPDLFLIDVDLGKGERGTDLAQRLRQVPGHAATPMIAVTAYADPDLLQEVLAAGMNDRIVKPIDRGELMATVAFWCHRGPSPCTEEPDLGALFAQFDNDLARCAEVLLQYRNTFTQWRVTLLQALSLADPEPIARVCHQLRPHLELLGERQAVAMLDGAKGHAPDDPVWQEVLQLLRCHERAFLKAMEKGPRPTARTSA